MSRNDIPVFLERMLPLYDSEQIRKLLKSHVLIAGLGGVGGYAAEALARAGIGKFTLIDGDKVEKSNINRQIIALHSTIGKSKAELVKTRISDINPQAGIRVIDKFTEPGEWERIFEMKFDYVVDAIDSVSPKLYLIVEAMKHNLPLISVMGSGGKRDPFKIRVADISKTRDDFFARTIRKRLKKHGIRKGFKTVFSTELQDKDALIPTGNTPYKKSAYGTVSYMPALFGLIAASEVIKDLISKEI
jgi:tRNA A37 threonylcarbamoyladenosine dehydratase